MRRPPFRSAISGKAAGDPLQRSLSCVPRPSSANNDNPFSFAAVAPVAIPVGVPVAAAMNLLGRSSRFDASS